MKNFINVQYKNEELCVNVNSILFVKPIRYGSEAKAQLHINAFGKNDSIKDPSDGALFVPMVLLLDSSYETVLTLIEEALDT